MGRSKLATILDENGEVFFGTDYTFTPGMGDWLRRGNDLTIVTYGALAPTVLEAWKLLKDSGVSAGVLNMASLIPLDVDSLVKAAGIGPILTVEDHHVNSGLGASAAMAFVDKGMQVKMKRLGVSHYGSSGKPAELYAEQGLDAQSIAQTASELLR
jgi:transketolase